MFQLDWAQKALWEKEAQLNPPGGSKLPRDDVRSAALLLWEEHCVECAIPVCFTSCSLYAPRLDKKCARFAYGIYPNPNFKGLFDYGADIRFRRWGKLEAMLYGKSATLTAQRFLGRFSRFLAVAPEGGVGGASELDSTRRFKRSFGVFAKTLLAKVCNKAFAWGAPGQGGGAFDAFVLECFSPEKSPFKLVIEYSAGRMTADHTFSGEIKLRRSFEIVPGWNLHTLPTEAFRPGDGPTVGKITLYPGNNAEARLIFTWLDLVQYREAHRPESPARQANTPVPATKVKCVAWDLDNTLWKGILAENTETELTPRPEALELIKKLDERGIIQTVVSKNNYADAWTVIERLGLQDYFLYPGINWQPKSQNLKEIADRLNINIDTFALIDDSAFERAEVQSAFPQVRMYSEDQIELLLTFPEFDVPVTEASKNRRMSYLTEVKRENVKEQFGGDYEGFLRSCDMKLRLFIPREENHIARCLELIQRSNQLNLSNRRYNAGEFRELLSREGLLCVAMDCRDRFGDYGIVGFASVEERQEGPTLRDLVLSCRVAQKRVEHTFVKWLAWRELARGKHVLAAALVKTERNKPIRQVFDDLRFRPVWEQNGHCLLELPLDSNIVIGDVIAVQTEL